MTHELLIPFETNDPVFVHGFEAGMLFSMIDREEDIDQFIHHENLNLFIKMCNKAQYVWQYEDGDNGWVKVFAYLNKSKIRTPEAHRAAGNRRYGKIFVNNL